WERSLRTGRSAPFVSAIARIGLFLQSPFCPKRICRLGISPTYSILHRVCHRLPIVESPSTVTVTLVRPPHPFDSFRGIRGCFLSVFRHTHPGYGNRRHTRWRLVCSRRCLDLILISISGF